MQYPIATVMESKDGTFGAWLLFLFLPEPIIGTLAVRKGSKGNPKDGIPTIADGVSGVPKYRATDITTYNRTL